MIANEQNPRGARNDAPGVLGPVGTVNPGLSEQPATENPASWGGAGPGTPSPSKGTPQGCSHTASAKPGQAPGGVVAQQLANNVTDMGYGPGFISEPANTATDLAGPATSEPNSNGTRSPAANKGPGGMGMPAIGAPLT